MVKLSGTSASVAVDEAGGMAVFVGAGVVGSACVGVGDIGKEVCDAIIVVEVSQAGKSNNKLNRIICDRLESHIFIIGPFHSHTKENSGTFLSIALSLVIQ